MAKQALCESQRSLRLSGEFDADLIARAKHHRRDAENAESRRGLIFLTWQPL